MKIGIFITAYNVEKQIVTKVLDKIPSNIHKKISEIIIIDNNSQDNTIKKAIKFKKHTKLNITILKNKKNYGYGGSHKVAFSYFIKKKFDYIILLHGDGQGNPKYIEKFIKLINLKKYDFIIGSRFLNQKTISLFSIRTFFNNLFSTIQRIFSGLNISDPGAGFIAYKINTIKKVPFYKLSSYMYFDQHLFLYLSRYKLKIKEFPVKWGKIEESNINIFEYGIKLLWLLINFKIKGIPLTKDKKENYQYEII